jgi:hypothetical protein
LRLIFFLQVSWHASMYPQADWLIARWDYYLCMYSMYVGSRTEWPDWDNFRPIGDCLLWVAFWKLQK